MIFKYYQILRQLYIKNTLASIFLLKILNKPYELLLSIIYGTHVPYNACIDFSCYFPHSFYGIFISGNAKIGKNCIIFHHVTIGSGFPNTEQAPSVKDDVLIGANATVLGDINIGRNVSIGGACVTKSIEDNSVVVSAKNRVFLK